MSVPVYGITELPMPNLANEPVPGDTDLVLAADGGYVAGYTNKGLVEVQVGAKGLKAVTTAIPSDTITSVSDQGLVAVAGELGSSPQNPGGSEPSVVPFGVDHAYGAPCLLYPLPLTGLDGPYTSCNLNLEGSADWADVPYLAMSGYVTAEGTVVGNSNCPPPGPGACASEYVQNGSYTLAGGDANGVYSWTPTAGAPKHSFSYSITPFGLSIAHADLGATVEAVAPDGDYAGWVRIFPPLGSTAPAYDTYVVGSYGSDFEVGASHFGIDDELHVTAMNDSDLVVGSLQRSGADNPVPWESHGAGELKRLSTPSSVTIPVGRYGQKETVTITGGAALGVNDDGDIVGYVTTDGPSGQDAVMWLPDGQFVDLNDHLSPDDAGRVHLAEAVGISAGGEILAVQDGGYQAVLVHPNTCSRISLTAPLRYRTGETVVDYKISGITLDCGPVRLTVDGKVVKTLPDDPSTQRGVAVVHARVCNPTVVAVQGDDSSQDDEGHPASGKILIAKDVKGPEGETLHDGDDLCGGENGAVLQYYQGNSDYYYYPKPGAEPVVIRQQLPNPLTAFKLTVSSDGALAATIAEMPAFDEVGEGGAIVPSSQLRGLDLIDDPAVKIYALGAVLGTRLTLGVGGGATDSATLPETGVSPETMFGKGLTGLTGLQPMPNCKGGPTVISGLVSLSATTYSCPLQLNNSVVFGIGASTKIDGGVLAQSDGSSSVGTVWTAGPLTITGPVDLATGGGTSHPSAQVTYPTGERDYSEPYMVFAPPKMKTVPSGGFDTPGTIFASTGAVVLMGA